MSTPFLSFLKKHVPAKKRLPLVHSTSGFYFKEIIDDNCIKPIKCPIFNEPLTYFFYGRPAYRVSSKAMCRTDFVLAPICIVFKPEALNNFKRIFPFDSGAFSSGMYVHYIPKHIKLDSFLLGNSLEISQQVISTFFGDNKSYYFGMTNKNLNFDFTDMEAYAYYQLITAGGETIHDDRRYTIEVQSDSIIDLSDKILAVVLPRSAMDDKKVYDTVMNKWKAYPITYDTYIGVSPKEYNAVIRQMLKNFLEAEGYL